MIVACPVCGAKYKFDDSKLQGASSKKLRCPKCKGIIEVSVHTAVVANKPGLSKEKTFKSSLTAEDLMRPIENGEAPSTAQVKRESVMDALAARAASDPGQKLPESRRYSIAVIQGNNSGEIYQITRTKTLIGRSDADIVIPDLEASRQHAQIDILGDRALLRDLNSTNGTFVDDEKINIANLDNQAEFRIGTTVLMFIVTDLE